MYPAPFSSPPRGPTSQLIPSHILKDNVEAMMAQGKTPKPSYDPDLD